MEQRLPLLKMAVAIVALTVVISAVMVPIHWDGIAGSTAAGKIDDLLKVMIVLSAFVYSIVLVMLGYALYKWRVKPGDEGDGLPIHGNTRLEVAWTVIPTIIVLFGAGYSWITLNDLQTESPDQTFVNVYSQQTLSNFPYPGTVKYSEGHRHVRAAQ